MYPIKTPHPLNFTYFTPDECVVDLTHLGEDIYRVLFNHPRWKDEETPAELTKLGFSKEKKAQIVLRGVGFEVFWGPDRVFGTLEKKGFGGIDQTWVVNFNLTSPVPVYGLGEKALPLNRFGIRTTFYNTDVWADFPTCVHREGYPDPLYASIPYFLLDLGNVWVGLLFPTPYPVFACLGADDAIADSLHTNAPLPKWFSIGAEGGRPELYLLVAEDPKTLTARMQRLQGTVPLPPLWALGYHQSRWGYGSYSDLDSLDQHFQETNIPCDALWLDIDYMDGFRVFTWDEKKFAQPKNQVEDLKKRSRRVVPILDPGIKKEEGFEAYDDAVRRDILCQNPEGKPFVGFVWPGETVFPDFSLPEARAFWSEQVQKFLRSNVDGFWLDMNDPSTGPVNPEHMLFQKGRKSHKAFRNAYCLGMQKATWEGLCKAYPEKRPFLISRSAFVSSSRYGGMWGGDNWSNRHHLKLAIPLCLSLSISGQPFCGVDIPGFGGDASPELAVDWYKACFLFPLFRNHSVKGSKPQEPWQFGEKVQNLIREYICLRYRFLPYLYALFAEQETTGTPILRPLFLEFAEDRREASPYFDTQFLVGPFILQAPHLESETREVYLPVIGKRWYDWFKGKWEEGGKVFQVKSSFPSTPLYLQEGAILPLQPKEADLLKKDLSAIEVHLFFQKSSTTEGVFRYYFDDGETRSYRKGFRTAFTFRVKVQGTTVRVFIENKAFHFSPCRISFVVYDKFEKVVLTDGIREEHLFTDKYEFSLPGKTLSLFRTRETVLKN
ncbi:MAG: TIM-barrel domain-containing protein [Spirochaetales bacterium]